MYLVNIYKKNINNYFLFYKIHVFNKLDNDDLYLHYFFKIIFLYIYTTTIN